MSFNITEEILEEITDTQTNIFDYIKDSKKYLIDICDKKIDFMIK